MIQYVLRRKQPSGIIMDNVSVVQNAKLWKFPAGEVGASLLPVDFYADSNVIDVEIVASMRDSDSFMQLLMFLDAANRKFPSATVRLHLPYLPYARQDRVCNEGESLSIAVIAKIINSFNLNRLYLYDVHSDVSLALFNNAYAKTQADIFAADLVANEIEVIVAPDAGAAKKIYAVASAMGTCPTVVIANKIRDVATGEIKSISIDNSAIERRRIAVVDDICDGGRTFIELSSWLGAASYKALYITHGVFSRGSEVLTSVYDEVFTTDSYGYLNLDDPKLVTKRLITKI